MNREWPGGAERRTVVGMVVMKGVSGQAGVISSRQPRRAWGKCVAVKSSTCKGLLSHRPVSGSAVSLRLPVHLAMLLPVSQHTTAGVHPGAARCGT